MIDFADFPTRDIASALRISGMESPPMASPPIFKKSRRDTPSQKARPRLPVIVSIS